MRRVACLTLALTLAILLSCSEIPTAPRLSSVIVTGRITDRDGPPIAGIRVVFQSQPNEAGIPTQTTKTTDADGRYSMKLAEGVYRVRLDPAFGTGYTATIVGETIKIGASGATIDYRYSGVRVSGSITGPNSATLPDAVVSTFGLIGSEYYYASSLNTAGSYSMLIPAGVYEFYATAGSFDSGLPQINSSNVTVASDTTINFSLTGFAVTATMTVGGGAPMMGAFFQAAGAAGDAAARTGLDGTATLYLPAGTYTLRALPFPQNIAGPRIVTRSIQGDDALTFDFSGPRWDVMVRRAADSAPLGGASVSFRDAGHNEGVSVSTDPFGRASCLVRAGTPYDLTITWLKGNTFGEALFSNLSSAADTTFDFSVSAP